MLNPYYTQRNEITNNTVITWQAQGYSSIGLDVSGTLTSGTATLQGTNDGVTWTNCQLVDDTTATVTAVGHVTVNVLGFNIVRWNPAALNATLTLYAVVTVEVAA